MDKTIRYAALALALASLFVPFTVAHADAIVSTLPPPSAADTEATTNLAVPSFEGINFFKISCRFDASPSNSLMIAIGQDADSDGNLSLRESSLFLGWSGQDWFIRRPSDRQWERYTVTDEASPHTLELHRAARLTAPDQNLALKRDDATLSFETDTSDWLALSSLQDGLVRVTTRGTGLSGQLTLCTEKDAHVMVVR